MVLITAFFLMVSCSNGDKIKLNNNPINIEYDQLPNRPGDRPATTTSIPHHQLDLDLVDDVHTEMIRRIYSVPGIQDAPSAIMSWQGLMLESNFEVANPQAFLSGREFGHIHDDGSLHIFLEPSRADEAIAAGWAVAHPFYAQGNDGWDGFVMLYTPQTIEELNVIFQLIVDSFNYVTGQAIKATDFY